MEMLPLRAGLPVGCDFTLPVLLRILPELPTQHGERPDIDLSLVIDRSGSMGGAPIAAAKGAATAAVSSLRATDRVSVVTFADQVQVLVPLQPLAEKNPVLELVKLIEAGGSTALFAGWSAGAQQLKAASGPARMRRVLLLTDGEANVGLKDADPIANHVSDLTNDGIQTTTLGFGTAYNENLLRSMAASGNGNHYYVERPAQLLEFFQLELAGLEATQGCSVSLEASPCRADLSVELLQKLPGEGTQGWKLPDLIAGCPQSLLFYLKVCPISPDSLGHEVELVTFRLSWTKPREGTRECQELTLKLPALSQPDYEALPKDGQVVEQMSIFDASQAQLQAARALSLGDSKAAIEALEKALADLRAAPRSQAQQELSSKLEGQLDEVKRGQASSAAKRITADAYYGSRGSVTLSHIGIREVLPRLGEVSNQVKSGVFPIQPPTNAIYGSHIPIPLSHDVQRVRGLIWGMWAGGSPGWEHCSVLLEALLQAGDFQVPEVRQAVATLRLEGAEFQYYPEWEHPGIHPDAGALPRLPVVVLANLRRPGMVVIDALLCTAMTHRNHDALVSAAALAAMLHGLLELAGPPPAEWWTERFAALAAPIQVDSELTDRVTAGIQADSWGAGKGLHETLPALLRLLSRSGDPPADRLEEVRQKAPWLGSIAGAALGILHGTDWVVPYGSPPKLLERSLKTWAP